MIIDRFKPPLIPTLATLNAMAQIEQTQNKSDVKRGFYAFRFFSFI
jgi:hypothetical protein